MPARFVKPERETPLSQGLQNVDTGATDSLASTKVMVLMLQQLGYETVEEALRVLCVAHRELTRQLGVLESEVQNVETALHGVASAVVSEEEEVIGASTYSLGVALNKIPHTNEVPAVPDLVPGKAAASPATLPESIDMVSEMTPVRVQAWRGMCVHMLHRPPTNTF